MDANGQLHFRYVSQYSCSLHIMYTLNIPKHSQGRDKNKSYKLRLNQKIQFMEFYYFDYY